MTCDKLLDCVIIGAGIYGLYSAITIANSGKNVLVLECESEAFSRSSYINQARVHNGYHYPRSVSTASKSAEYFQRFSKEFSFAINYYFKKIYALSSKFSYTNGEQFKKFCNVIGIPCRDIDAGEYFNKSMVDSAFETEEFAFDAFKIRDFYLNEISKIDNIEISYNTKIVRQETKSNSYLLTLNNGQILETPYIINTTYASINQILEMFGFEKFRIKYEICEIALCKPNKALSNIGLTIMDGPFFSIMPFGLEGLFSLTSVMFTPHLTSYELLPTFKCQEINNNCSSYFLDNCNTCKAHPKTAWNFMSQLAKNYLKDEYNFTYSSSLFAIKPILMASELDDSRPTVIREFNKNPRFISVLSGKINTIYDLDEFII